MAKFSVGDTIVWHFADWFVKIYGQTEQYSLVTEVSDKTYSLQSVDKDGNWGNSSTVETIGNVESVYVLYKPAPTSVVYCQLSVQTTPGIAGNAYILTDDGVHDSPVTVQAGTTVLVGVNLVTGWEVSSWNNDTSSTEQEMSVTVNEDTNIVIAFKEIETEAETEPVTPEPITPTPVTPKVTVNKAAIGIVGAGVILAMIASKKLGATRRF